MWALIFAGVLFAQTGWAQPCAAPANPVIAENCLQGNPSSEWSITGAGSSAIQGFATEISVNKGSTIGFKVSTPATTYRLDIYRMGFYGGDGARKVATVHPSASLPQSQPSCLNEASTGLIDCGNWAVSAQWVVPSGAVSGIYFARLVREDGRTGASHIYFVVRDDTSTADLVFQTADTTWHAYNSYGGNSLYEGQPDGRAYKISYNRPLVTRGNSFSFNTVWTAEYPMVRWLESNGYNVSYISGVDTDRRGADLLRHKVYLSVGHDEYWSAAQRANVEAARNAGVNLAFFSGNEMFWKVRWENSMDGTNTPYRTMVCYKETHANAKIDPSTIWTGTWRDPRFTPPSDGGRPENALTGTLFAVNGYRADSLEVPERYGKLRLWRNTAVASLAPGDKAVFPAGTLGYEWDTDENNGSRPPGLMRLSETTVDVHARLQDYGSTYEAGPATHYLTMYRHSSGALVFGAGTSQWTWGLDSNHDNPPSVADVRMQQATVNLLADMSVQPGSIQPGLFPAVKTSDAQAPVVAVTSPVSGASVPAEVELNITGTASDAGGVLAGVELSVDGSTWEAASVDPAGWSFRWTPVSVGSYTIRVRATDDSGNISGIISVPVTVTPATCPCGIWPPSTTPSVLASSDGTAVEVGLRFQPSRNGYISALQFYKGPGNGGVHVGNLWSNTGELLASATFTSETASGWQQVMLPTAVPVTANTTYVASYHAPQGHYSQNLDYFNTASVRGIFRLPANGEAGPNGVFLVSPTSAFPTNVFRATNYWVDVVFTTQTPNNHPPVAVDDSYSIIQGQTLNVAAPGLLGNDTDTDEDQLVAFKLTNPASGNLLFNANGGFTYTPAAGFTGTVSFTYKANDGSLDSAPATVTITVTAAPVNHPPVAANDAYTSIQGQTLNIAAPGLLANDTDQDGQTLTPTVVTSPGNGSLAVDANGGFIYTPAPLYTGAVTFTYKVSDGLADSNIATVTITVNSPAPNTPPVAASDSYTIRQGQTLKVATPGVLANDTDGDGQSVTAVKMSDPASGTLFLNSTGGFTYTPTAGFTGAVTFTYSANDGSDNSSPATVTINVNAPGACPCNIWAPADTPAVPDSGDARDVELGMRFRASVDGHITGLRFYKGSAANSGVHTGRLWTNTGTLLATATFITESASGWQEIYFPAPVLITAGNTYVVSYEAPLGRYSKSEQFFTGPVVRGSLTALADGQDGPSGVYRYADGEMGFPDASYNSTNYWVDVVFMPIPVANRAPVATGNTYSVITGEALTVTAPGVLGNDTDADGDPLTAIKLSDPASGSLSFNSNGSFIYTPAPGFTGTVSFTYRATDGTLDSSPANVTINVQQANTPPVAVNDSYTVSAGQTLSVAAPGLLTNDSDADGNPLTAVKVSDPASGILTFNASGGFTYAPAAGFTGTVSFTYKVNDGIVDSPTATVTITVNSPPGNNVPVANGDSYTIRQGETLTVSTPGVLANDSDGDGQTLTALKVSDPASGTVQLNAAGGFVYTPVAGFTGSVTFTYRAFDGIVNSAPATVTITVASSGSCPCTIWNSSDIPAVPNAGDSNSVELAMRFRASEDGTLAGLRFYKGAASNGGVHTGRLWTSTGTLLATATFASESATGWQQVYFAAPVALTPGVTYVVSYHAPQGGYSKTEQFFVSSVVRGPLTALADGQDGPNGAYRYGSGGVLPTSSYQQSNYWVDVVFLPSPGGNHSPVAANDNYSVVAGQALTVAAPGVMSNDTDVDGDSLTATKLTDPASGTVSFNANGGFVYTPAPGFAGAATFTYRVNDGTANSNAATVTINVAPANSAPVAVNDTYTVGAGQTLSVSAPGILANDTDAEGNPLTAVKLSDPASGTLTLNANGGLTFTPASGFSGAVTFTYAANDGIVSSSAATVTINITPAGSCPCTIWNATDIPVTTASGDTGSVELGMRFRPAQDGVITGIRFYKGAGNSGIHTGRLWTNSGSLLSTLTFVNETSSGWQQGSFAVPVPVTAGTTYLVSYHAPQGHYAKSEAYFVSPITRGPLTALADNGAVRNGVYQYGGGGVFPSSSFNSSNYWVDVVYEVTSGINHAPVAVNDSFSVASGQTLTVSVPGVLANDTDADNDTLTATAVTNPASGTLTLNSNGSFVYSPSAGFTGTASFTYKVNDGTVDSNSATVTINVTQSNRPPAALNDTYSVVSGQTLTVTAPGLLANDTDPDGDVLTAVKVTDPSCGTLTLNANGSLTYVSASGFSGSATFTYSARDGLLNSPPATVTINVAPPGTCPCMIWTSADVPAVAASPSDSNAVELGMRFRPNEDGVITGVRFYKGAGNGGTHIGRLWSNTGTLLGSATFVNETPTGWQQVLFATPISVIAGTTYVVSYHAPQGHYAKSEGFFSAPVVRGPLTALADGQTGSNGLYRYGASGVFPTNSFNQSNYWIDVLFMRN